MIIRLVVEVSHDQFRGYRQMDKSIPDLATRSFSSEVRNLLVKLLNEANSGVREVHESESGKRLIAKGAKEQNGKNSTEILSPTEIERMESVGRRKTACSHKAR